MPRVRQSANGHIFAFTHQWLAKSKTSEDQPHEILRVIDAGGKTRKQSTARKTSPPSPFHGLEASGGISSLTAGQLEQYKVAGLPPEYQPPPAPFPVASYPRTDRKDFFLAVQDELDQFEPPLFFLHRAPDESQARKFTSREKHLAIVNTVLHVSLLRGEYARAERAWALMLRVSYNACDMRPLARWGIAAELLMARKRNSELSDDEEDDENESDRDSPFTQQGFELAKQFYERLIIQYPYFKHLMHHNFYPSLITVWIYQIVQRAKTARARLAADGKNGKQLSKIRSQELEAATELADRLDSILIMPPHDQNADLLQLRESIKSWMTRLE
jgi:hypothetical protein